MTYEAATPDEYLAQLPPERQAIVRRLRETVLAHLPEGFEETMSYGMIGYAVPHRLYPAGYHANPKEPLPFLALASQKRHIALYHLGLYSFPDLLEWFQAEYERRGFGRLDMGKSCIRFRETAAIPYDLVAELCGKITVADYVARYEATLGDKGRGRG